MEVEKTEPSVTRKVRYSYDFLLSQKIAIQAQKDREIAQRDKELAEVDDLIVKANLLGLKVMPKPPIV